MLKKIEKVLFGSSDDREINKMKKDVEKINKLEPEYEVLTDDQ